MQQLFIRRLFVQGTSLNDMYMAYGIELEKLGDITIKYEFPTHYPSDGIIYQMAVELHYIVALLQAV